MLSRALRSVEPLLAAASLSLAVGSAQAQTPVVVAELFTSQGCATCTAADALPADLAERKGVLALTFPVDYWDYLGWRDTYAQPAFSDRQKAYARALGVREVYTPQVVVDGVSQTGAAPTGQSLADSTDGLILKAARTQRSGPAIAFLRHDQVRVGAGPSPRGGAEVWLVRYQAGPAEVAVTSGENRGRTVRYRNVVRELERLGPWTGQAKVYDQPQASAGDLKSAVLVQAKGGGPILAALSN